MRRKNKYILFIFLIIYYSCYPNMIDNETEGSEEYYFNQSDSSEFRKPLRAENIPHYILKKSGQILVVIGAAGFILGLCFEYWANDSYEDHIIHKDDLHRDAKRLLWGGAASAGFGGFLYGVSELFFVKDMDTHYIPYTPENDNNKFNEADTIKN